MQAVGQALLTLASILHLGKSGLPTTAIDEDSNERILVAVKVLSDPSAEVIAAFTTASHEQFVHMLTITNEQKEKSKVPSSSFLSWILNSII